LSCPYTQPDCNQTYDYTDDALNSMYEPGTSQEYLGHTTFGDEDFRFNENGEPLVSFAEG